MNKKSNIKFLLGLDLGTTALKGVLMESNGKIIAEVSQDTCFLEPQTGWFEIDPEEYYRNVCAAIKTLAEQADGEIKALAIAAASGNTLLTDETGKPLTKVISWLDQRAVQNMPKNLTALSAVEVRQVIGWPCVNTFSMAHLAWLQENRPELYSQAGRYCMNSNLLTFRLTGHWRMDYSTATPFHLQDQEHFKYHKPYLKMLDIPEAKLSRLMPSGRIIGNLTPQAVSDTGLSENTLLVSGSFDHPAAARSLGILEPGKLMLSCGTSWVGFFPEPDRSKIVALKMLCDPFLAPEGGPWGAIFSVPGIGRNINWYIDRLAVPDGMNKLQIFNQLAAQAKPGAGGTKIDLTKTPTPLDASPENICRAVMEGAAELLKAKLNVLAAKGIRFNDAVMVGGASKSPIWPKIIEQITGISLSVGSQHAGAKGAAILAGIGAGIYKDEHDAFAQTRTS